MGHIQYERVPAKLNQLNLKDGVFFNFLSWTELLGLTLCAAFPLPHELPPKVQDSRCFYLETGPLIFSWRVRRPGWWYLVMNTGPRHPWPHRTCLVELFHFRLPISESVGVKSLKSLMVSDLLQTIPQTLYIHVIYIYTYVYIYIHTHSWGFMIPGMDGQVTNCRNQHPIISCLWSHMHTHILTHAYIYIFSIMLLHV